MASSFDEHDTLGRWLAQYIAEQITTYEASEGEAREAAGRRTLKAILKLWKHRADRMGRRPLGTYEPVMAGLARLSGEVAWGIGDVLRGRGAKGDQLDSLPLLRIALALESSVKDILLAAFSLVAREAENREAAWLDLPVALQQDAEGRAIQKIRDTARRRRLTDPRLALTDPGGVGADEVDPDDAVEVWLRASLDTAQTLAAQARDALDSDNYAVAAAAHSGDEPWTPASDGSGIE